MDLLSLGGNRYRDDGSTWQLFGSTYETQPILPFWEVILAMLSYLLVPSRTNKVDLPTDPLIQLRHGYTEDKHHGRGSANSDHPLYRIPVLAQTEATRRHVRFCRRRVRGVHEGFARNLTSKVSHPHPLQTHVSQTPPAGRLPNSTWMTLLVTMNVGHDSPCLVLTDKRSCSCPRLA
jgi:hypothetical protein